MARNEDINKFLNMSEAHYTRPQRVAAVQVTKANKMEVFIALQDAGQTVVGPPHVTVPKGAEVPLFVFVSMFTVGVYDGDWVVMDADDKCSVVRKEDFNKLYEEP